MKKILLLISCIFLITGCKVEYNLSINNDLKVSEEVVMTGTDEFFDSFYKSSKLNVIETMLNDFRREELENNNYDYSVVEGDKPYVVARKNYSNIDEFSSSTIFQKQYFEDIEVLEKDGIITINSVGFMPIDPDSIERYLIRSTTISISLPYEVVENNASSFDNKNNTYTWYINDDMKDFSINLSYDTNKIYVPPKISVNWLSIIITILVILIIVISNYVNNKKGKKLK